MELIGRMLDGSIPYDDTTTTRLEPVSSGPGSKQDDKIDRLEAVSLFAGCSRRQLQAVARITRAFDAAAGTVLARAGEPGEELFLIVDGVARVKVSDTKEVRLGAGEIFGEMSLLDGGPRSATVVAETVLRLLVINRTNFETLLEKVPGLTKTLLVTLSRRVRLAEAAAAEMMRASQGL